MKRLIFLCPLLIVIFLPGCLQQPANSTVQPNNNGMCVPPAVTAVPDPMGQLRDIWTSRKILRALMPGWWSPQSTQNPLFSIIQPGQIFDGLSDIAVRDEIVWIAFSFHVSRYDSSTGETTSYQVTDHNNNILVVADILIGHDGEVWALAYNDNQEYVTLAHYNKISDRFEIVFDRDGLLQETGSHGYYYFVKSQVLAESSDGKILFPFKKNIIAYDPQSNVASYLLPLDFSFPVAAMVVSDGKIWFTVGEDYDKARSINTLLPEEKDLRSIDLQTGKFVDYGHTDTILDLPAWWYMKDDFRPVSVDALGRVWMGYFSRLISDQNGGYTWEQVDIPPEFVVADDPDFVYLWAGLSSVYTSSTGNLWFKSQAGLVMYDPQKDIWCTSMPIRPLMAVTEDEQGNMWLALDSGKYNAIYELKKPTTNK